MKNFNQNTVLGQHFLQNQKAITKITQQISPNNIIIEIGAGDGRITQLIAKKAKKVIAVEIDPQYYLFLNRLSKKYRHLIVLNKNVLDINFNMIDKSLIKQKPVIIGSLPYHIIEPLFFKLITEKFLKAVFIIGAPTMREIKSEKQQPTYGKLNFLINTIFDWKILTKLGATDFDPKPPSDAYLVEFKFKNGKIFNENLSLYLSRYLLIANQSGQKIKNCLKNAIINWSNNQLTQKQALTMINKLKIPEEILNKSFSQLNNLETSFIVSQLEIVKTSPSSKA